jgi:hypothetical protein
MGEEFKIANLIIEAVSSGRAVVIDLPYIAEGDSANYYR